jgi:hypothetical protein
MRNKSLWSYDQSRHVRSTAIIFWVAGAAMLALALYLMLQSVMMSRDPLANTKGAGSAFVEILLSFLSIGPFGVSALFFVFGVGLLRHKETARYEAMFFCALTLVSSILFVVLAPTPWIPPVAPMFSGLAVYGLWALTRRWKRLNPFPSISSILM